MVDAVYDYRDDDLRAVAAYLAALPWPRAAAER
jgi:cytochrome c553